jgi:hypothetical protein
MSDDYLHKREALMQYPQFRRDGWPIGSGMVESANKNVVEARDPRDRNALATQECQSHARITQCGLQRSLARNVAEGARQHINIQSLQKSVRADKRAKKIYSLLITPLLWSLLLNMLPHLCK